MEINRLKVRGFKNLGLNNLYLNNINGILAINSFGKSNLLQAIDFGFDFILHNNLVKENMMRWKPGYPIVKNLREKDFLFEFEFNEQLGNEIYNVIYGYEFSWHINKDDPSRITKEYLKIKKNSPGQKYSTYINRNEQDATYKTSITGRCDKEVKIDNNDLLINKLKAFDDLFYLPIVKKINNIKFYIDKHFDSDDLYSVSRLIKKNVNDLSPIIGDAGGIARALHKLEISDNVKYTSIIDAFKKFFPNIEDIKIETIDLSQFEKIGSIPEDSPFEYAEKAYIILVKDKYIDSYINFKLMSDGAKRLLSILTSITLANKDNIPLIAIEEPENSICPSLLEKYIKVLNTFTTECKIILTSHSPNLVNFLDLKDLFLGINDNGISQFYKLKATSFNKIETLSRSDNKNVGSYLFDLMSDENKKELLMSFMDNEQINLDF